VFHRPLYKFLFCTIALSLSVNLLTAQDEGEIIILHEKVGKLITREENKKYELFPGKDRFKSAVIRHFRNGTYLVKINYEDLRTGEESIEQLKPRESEIEHFRNKVEYFAKISSSIPLAITLYSGREIKGTILSEDEKSITVITKDYEEEQILKSSIFSKEYKHGYIKKGIFYHADPNYSRLLLSPTGRALRKGEISFTNHYLFLQGAMVGITDRIDIGAGGVISPDFTLGGGYVTSKIALISSEKLGVSMGAILSNPRLNHPKEAYGMMYLMGTYGRQDRSFTAGIGLHYFKKPYDVYNSPQDNRERYILNEKNKWNITKRPVIILGGNIRLSKNCALVSENWLFAGDWLWGSTDYPLKEQPFALALRRFSEHFTVDVGVVLVPFILKESGYPVPWISFAYNFGR